MLATAAQIEKNLWRGGVHRYAADSYYGGGSWLLLTAWLGWYYSELACRNPTYAPQALEKARVALQWVESKAGRGAQNGWLPEQIPENLNDPTFYPKWVLQWGEIANPLLWSHAKYLILRYHLDCLGR
jgi:GH15 family glucan-1,4-alpha-glucosidase